MNLIEELEWRGALYDSTEGAEAVLEREQVTAYNGFDPSAKSLHVGNLVPIMGLVRLQRHGHTPIAVVGGGTGMIGDPSGRSEERTLLDARRIEENVEGIREQLARFLDFDAKRNPALLINNAEWLLESRTVDFLRDVGKHFTVRYMLAKESVKGRMADREEGISFTEFSYMLLQAYDFQVLYDRFGCTFQMGGSDQWGNILAGVELVRRTRRARAHGVVYPLITTASGEKFGKSVGNAPTLDPEETSPYRLYQFFMNVEDADAIRYLKLFTLLGQDEIAEQEEALSANPAAREAQRTLAREVTRMVHGDDGARGAERASKVLFGAEIEGLGAEDLLDIFADVPSSKMAKSSLEGGITVTKLAFDTGLTSSSSEARRVADQGGLYLNNRRVFDGNATVGIGEAIDGRVLVLRRGAKTYHLIEVV